MGFFSKPEVVGPGGTYDVDRAQIVDLERRVARLEAQLAQLTQQTGSGDLSPVPADAWMSDVQALKSDGKLIHAIKLYRDKTGVGLKEAKDAVEALPG